MLTMGEKKKNQGTNKELKVSNKNYNARNKGNYYHSVNHRAMEFTSK